MTEMGDTDFTWLSAVRRGMRVDLGPDMNLKIYQPERVKPFLYIIAEIHSGFHFRPATTK
jgi:hypothetical protein